MKLNPTIVILMLVALAIGYYVIFRRREAYPSDTVDPNEIRALGNDKGIVNMTSYDNKETKTFEIVVDGKYMMLKGTNENGTDFYVTFNNDEITNTNTLKPNGEYKFRPTKALNGDKGYYSLAMADSERFFMIDVTNVDAGIIDLKDVDDLSKKVRESKAFNFRFTKP